jgi:uncharacterized membrane protein (DUF485 family)
MPEDNNKCQDCSDRQKCEEVYRKMAGSEGPPVTFSVIMAFLLPLVIFIAALAAGQVLLKRLNANLPVTAISLILAFLVTACYVLVARVIVKNRAKRFDK